MTLANKPPAIFLMGPTASGKTDLAIKLCQQLPCEIISVDSALIYRGMNIGSAKPSAEELALAPHRLIDIRDPAESYSAAEFRADALAAMQQITAAGKIPLLVGGSMLYFKTLLEGIADMPVTEPAIRAQINRDAELNGWPFVHAQLAAVDPASAERIHPNHSQRIERALAVYLSSGVTMTEYRRRQQQQQAEQSDRSATDAINDTTGQASQHYASDFPYQLAQLAIAPQQRKVLHRRIEKRFLQMMEQGIVDEVRMLRQRADLHLDLPSMRAVGYRQVWQHLDGELTVAEMTERGIIATRQLAKRQFTWLKSWQNLQWLLTDEQGLLVSDAANTVAGMDFSGQQPINMALKYIHPFVM
jgi:tRNA dimethylallyltransferase